MSFRPGWYEIGFDPKTFRKTCRYFKSTSVYVAECYLEPNGQQILIWQDPQFLNGPGRPAAWQAAFRELPTAPAGDWWDNPPGGARSGPASAGAFDRAARQPSAVELTQRAATVDRSLCGLDCIKEINVGIFFDGTNNNMDRDMADNSHSNIVSLFNAHKLDRTDNFRYYIPGVGTKFPEIGENSEDPSGKKYAAGGEARIHYAMLQVFNAVCSASTQSDLATEAEMRQIVTSSGADGLSTWWRLSDAKMVSFFERLNARLLKSIDGKRPKVVKVHVSVFGFSRGAAEARVFVNWLQLATGGQVGHAALNIKFLGIFDTVASVFLADSSPVGSGFFDWADGNLDIAGVASTEHFVASHEIRLSFPLSTARAGGAYPSNTKERAYPGAHSDVGGGYAPGDQGKGKAGRAAMVSQIPLNDMHFSALNAGASLMKTDEMVRAIKVDFAVDPKLNGAFDAYAEWTAFDDKENFAATGQRAENRLMDHMHLYWRWRASVSSEAEFRSLQFYAASEPQDRIDLWESELDWRTDIERAREAAKPRTVRTGRGETATIPPNPSPAQRQLLIEITRGASVPAGAAQLFDQFVHDSHAGFWMLGPQTLEDRRTFITLIKQKKARYDEFMALASQARDIESRYNLENMARAYELNNFERRVLAADAAVPDSMPLMSDADAAEMRANAGWVTSVALTTLVGTNSRREPHGHGRYRRVFDRS